MTKTRKPSAVVTEAAEAIAKAAGKTPTPAPAANAELKPRITMNLTTGKVKVTGLKTARKSPIEVLRAKIEADIEAGTSLTLRDLTPKSVELLRREDPDLYASLDPDGEQATPVTVVPEGASGAAAAEAIRAAVEAKAAAKSKADRDSLKATPVVKTPASAPVVKTPTALKAYTPRTTTAAGATVKVTKAAAKSAAPVKGDAVTQLTAASNKPAPTGARPRGLLSAPPADMPLVINEEAASRISKGFTAEMLAMARRLVRASKSKTFTRAQLLAKYEGAGHTRGKLMDAFYAGTERGVYVPAA